MKVADVKALASELRPHIEAALDRRRECNRIFMGAWRAGQIDALWNEIKQDEKLSNYCLHYFIRARGIGDFKIGRTNALGGRFTDILTGCSRGADLVACYFAEAEHEAELHQDFAHLRLNGEWFEEHPDLTGYLELIGGDPRDCTNIPPARRPAHRRRAMQ